MCRSKSATFFGVLPTAMIRSRRASCELYDKSFEGKRFTLTCRKTYNIKQCFYKSACFELVDASIRCGVELLHVSYHVGLFGRV